MPAHRFFGNNGTVSGPPGYNVIGVDDITELHTAAAHTYFGNNTGTAGGITGFHTLQFQDIQNNLTFPQLPLVPVERVVARGTGTGTGSLTDCPVGAGLRFSGTGGFTLSVSDTYTVATLPSTGNTIGDMASISDGAASLGWGATAAGGGSTPYLVWWNGTHWTVIGH